MFIPLVFGFQDNVVPDAQAVTAPGTTPYSAALQILLATIVSPDRLPGVITLYPSGNTPLSANIALAAAATDAIFACNAHTIDKSVSQFVPVFAYEFNDEQAPDNFLSPTTLHDGTNYPYGSDHTSEIQGLFPVSNPSGVGARPQADAVDGQSAATRPSDGHLLDDLCRYRQSKPGRSPTAIWPQSRAGPRRPHIVHAADAHRHETRKRPHRIWQKSPPVRVLGPETSNLSPPSIVNLGVPNLP